MACTVGGSKVVSQHLASESKTTKSRPLQAVFFVLAGRATNARLVAGVLSLKLHQSSICLRAPESK